MKLLKFGLLAAAIIAVAHAEEEFDEGTFFVKFLVHLKKRKKDFLLANNQLFSAFYLTVN